MFMHEWRRRAAREPLRTIAIVDDAPREQYLFPEFLLMQKLFAARGLNAIIVDARELAVDADALTWRGQRIDLVYNRCTDFYFAEPAHAALAEAYARDLAVITPHPHAHALYSNKRNLVTLSDESSLRAMQAMPADMRDIAGRRSRRRVWCPAATKAGGRIASNGSSNPSSGFGSRGTYRGDKITRRAFGDVMRGDYIAQAIAPPGERWRGMRRTANVSSSMCAVTRMTEFSSFWPRASIRARPPTSARRAADSRRYTCSTTPRRELQGPRMSPRG